MLEGGGRTRSWEHHLNDDPTRFQVFCRSLGFSGGIKYKDEVRPTPGPGFGQLLGRFNCRGDEINVGDCIRDTQYMPGIKHYICILYILYNKISIQTWFEVLLYLYCIYIYCRLIEGRLVKKMDRMYSKLAKSLKTWTKNYLKDVMSLRNWHILLCRDCLLRDKTQW